MRNPGSAGGQTWLRSFKPWVSTCMVTGWVSKGSSLTLHLGATFSKDSQEAGWWAQHPKPSHPWTPQVPAGLCLFAHRPMSRCQRHSEWPAQGHAAKCLRSENLSLSQLTPNLNSDDGLTSASPLPSSEEMNSNLNHGTRWSQIRSLLGLAPENTDDRKEGKGRPGGRGGKGGGQWEQGRAETP